MRAAIYARVSTKDQDCGLQLTAAREFCDRQQWERVEYVEKASGKRGSLRPVLEQLLADARLKKFDVVLVWKMDRFGRSVSNLIDNIQTLVSCGVRFYALTQNIDTGEDSPMGRFVVGLFALLAEFERDMIVERVTAGVAEARRRGKTLGRPRKVFRRDNALELRAAGLTFRAIAAKLKVPKSVIERELKRRP